MEVLSWILLFLLIVLSVLVLVSKYAKKNYFCDCPSVTETAVVAETKPKTP